MTGLGPYTSSRGVKYYGFICCALSPQSAVRRFFAELIDRGSDDPATPSYFDRAIMVVIAFAVVRLAQFDPYADAVAAITAEEIFVNAVFSVEFLIVATARGLIAQKHAHLQDLWGWLDLLVVLAGWLPFISSGCAAAAPPRPRRRPPARASPRPTPPRAAQARAVVRGAARAARDQVPQGELRGLVSRGPLTPREHAPSPSSPVPIPPDAARPKPARQAAPLGGAADGQRDRAHRLRGDRLRRDRAAALLRRDARRLLRLGRGLQAALALCRARARDVPARRGCVHAHDHLRRRLRGHQHVRHHVLVAAHRLHVHHDGGEPRARRALGLSASRRGRRA